MRCEKHSVCGIYKIIFIYVLVNAEVRTGFITLLCDIG